MNTLILAVQFFTLAAFCLGVGFLFGAIIYSDDEYKEEKEYEKKIERLQSMEKFQKLYRKFFIPKMKGEDK